MTYQMINISAAGVVDQDEGDETAAIDWLKAANFTPGLLLTACFNSETGTWFYWQEPGQAIMHNMITTGRPAEPVPALEAEPEPAPADMGAGLKRRIDEINKAPLAWCETQSLEAIQVFLSAYGDLLNTRAKNALTDQFAKLAKAEKEAAHQAPAPEPEDQAAAPGAALLRRQAEADQADQEAAARALVLEAKGAEIDAANLDPIAFAKDMTSEEIFAFREACSNQLPGVTLVSLSVIAQLKAHDEAEEAEAQKTAVEPDTTAAAATVPEAATSAPGARNRRRVGRILPLPDDGAIDQEKNT